MTSRAGADLTASQRTELWREVFRLADHVLDLDAAEQQAFVQRCIADNPAVGAELQALIESSTAESVLESSASSFAASIIEEGGAGPEIPGGGQSMFGPYRVCREIGRGGMGAVYLAERSDDQYQKQVALKVLPPRRGGDGRGLQRFLDERQILAALDHPGIARLLDGGITDDGVPWFAMEYIDGKPIDMYCDDLRLPVEKRLELFCQVCAAVQYAHRNLVVHRDLKPSNILVSATGRVALLDFGIARLIAEDAATLAAATATGDRLLTPLYASPEQMRGEPASTAVDVYALGLLLHALLTGNYPYRLSNLESYEVARAVLEQEPERPSLSIAREGGPVSSRTAHRTPEERALARGTTPVKLARRLRGDLDAIVLMAIDKEPGRRYATAEQLETDVGRHLARLPVLATAQSGVYVLRKFVRRHRAGVAMAVAAAIVVVSFAAAMTVQRSRIARERDQAEQLSGFFINTFRRITPGDSGIAARDILDSATAHIDEDLSASPEQRARITYEMARAYHGLDVNGRARELLDASLTLQRGFDPRPNLAIAETQNLRGAVLLAEGQADLAEQAYSEALTLRRRELGADHADVARSLVGISSVLLAQRRFAESVQAAREAVAIDRSRGPGGRADLGRSSGALGHALMGVGDAAGAAAHFRRALSLVRETLSEEHSAVAAALFDLALALHATGDVRGADSLNRHAVRVQQRALTSAALRGTAVALPAGARAPGDISAIVERSLASQPVSVTPASGVASPNGRIAFTSDRDGPDPLGDRGNQEIYVMNVDGSGQQRLTHEKAADSGPAWSPDGSKLAFTSQRAGGFDIFVMDARGGPARRLTHFTERGLGAAEPAWSPDGKRIVFRSRTKQLDIWVINADGTGAVQLTNDAAADGAPAWSPDGRRIAFSSRRGGPAEIMVMDADGKNVKRLTTNAVLDSRPNWSPDSRRIVFHSERDGNREIYVMNADGTNVDRLTDDPVEDGHPSFSPDGRHIVFHKRVLGHVQIHVMNADGSGLRRLTALSPVAFSGFPTWGPAPRR
ncbi:MAG: WD40 repeat domain-containing serine/threonine protein kinase [Gemmatimonadaceae bacterium]